ncbi:MAG: type II toxin-antitoxin system RelE/ParE family toxin [Proteobacteria bacterium]|nr:type II toxin-antitoxin system RelE/ParE family toxin [Pseudomonadota bacterium]
MKLDATDWNPESKRTTRGRPARAGAFGSELKQKTLVLADQPGLGRTGRPGMPTGVRELVVHPNYIIIHRVREAERTVEILRVKHASRQVP